MPNATNAWLILIAVTRDDDYLETTDPPRRPILTSAS